MPPWSTTGVVINYSQGGYRIAVTRPIPVGTVFDARVKTQVESHVRMRVVWNRALIDGCLVGLQVMQRQPVQKFRALI